MEIHCRGVIDRVLVWMSDETKNEKIFIQHHSMNDPSYFIAYEWNSKLGKLYFTKRLGVLDNKIMSFQRINCDSNEMCSGFEQKLTENELSHLHNIMDYKLVKILSNENILILASQSSIYLESIGIMQIIGRKIKIYTNISDYGVDNDKPFNRLKLDDLNKWSIHPTEPLFIIKNKLYLIEYVNDNDAKITELYDVNSLALNLMPSLDRIQQVLQVLMTETKIILCMKSYSGFPLIYYINNPYFDGSTAAKEIVLKKLENVPDIHLNHKFNTSKIYRDLFFISCENSCGEAYLHIYKEDINDLKYFLRLQIARINYCPIQNDKCCRVPLLQSTNIYISKKLYMRRGQLKEHDHVYKLPLYKKPIWNICRLLWIAKHKNKTSECHLSKLPRDIIRYLSQFLTEWTYCANKNIKSKDVTNHEEKYDIIRDGKIYKSNQLKK